MKASSFRAAYSKFTVCDYPHAPVFICAAIMAMQNVKSTQCNFYLLNKPKTASKGTTVDIKTKCKNVSTQTTKKFPTATVGNDSASSTCSLATARAGGGSRETISPNPSSSCRSDSPCPGVTQLKRRMHVHVQCGVVSKTASTQTVNPSSMSKAVQSDEELDVSASPLEQAIYVLKTVAELWILAYEIKLASSGKLLLVLTRPDLLGLYGEGVEPIRLTLNTDCVLNIMCLFSPVKTCNIAKNSVELDVGKLVDTLRPFCSENLVLCRGIKEEYVGISPACVISLNVPFSRHMSKKCDLWYVPSTPVTKLAAPVCLHCKYMTKYLTRTRLQKQYTTPSKKFRRRQITSNYSFFKLTPLSKQIRLNRLRDARAYTRQKLRKLEAVIKEKQITLNEEQSLEMDEIVQSVNRDHRNDLEEVLNTTSAEQRELLQSIWDKDSEIKQRKDAAQFFQDQRKNISGQKANRWSSVTYRIALAVSCRSAAAYNALRSFHILQLPSIRSLQTKTSTFLNNPGINQGYIKKQAAQYEQFSLEKESKGELKPCGEGVLIFDEVKVIDKIMWNSKNHEFIGLAMTEEDFPYLNDIFIQDSKKKTAEPTAAKYILQFVWRDLTSDFDVIGPYFSCLQSLEHKFIIGCVFETMRVFHAYGFKVKCLVCDGASENLATIKTTMARKGAFGYQLHDNDIDLSIKPVFQNPFESDYLSYWVICPSHQLKNMISALHSSRAEGPKEFTRNSSSVSWEQIKNVKKRDDHRFKQGQLRIVPGLQEAYIVRDSWTRLNVRPSKIMQQEALLSELYSYSQERHEDSNSAFETYKYLRACNQLFESGMLSKCKVKNIQSESVQSMLTGYTFFENWLREILDQEADFQPNSSKQKKFISWQTWDLLRICVFGLKGLVEDFLQEHPDYFLVLSRINGSVVESLFSQFKYATGSKLSSVNYAQARKSVIMKSNVQGSHPSNKDYRNVPLYIREQDL